MGEPVYFKIANELRKGIFEGKFNPGDLMPSENELASSFNSSRVTTRKSLGILENEGLIAAWHGKGYFVQTPEHNKYTMYFEEHNPAFKSKIQKVTVVKPTDEVKNALSLKEGQKVVLIRRIVLNDDIPVACDEKYIPYNRGDPLVETEIQYADFPEIVAAKSSPFAIQTDMEIGFEVASANLSVALSCRQEEPLLVTYRYIINHYGIKVGFEKMYMRKAYGRLRAHSGYSFVGKRK
ncbi:MAG: GntR family transcriptional regulator [Clostridia bacterium]|nr:GntR family transcriptional regulator [Clostridia bacterium]MDR3643610.1 GntR family transcriptional regulator [Clostridia bacterium]